jgi:hypothetical protein
MPVELIQGIMVAGFLGVWVMAGALVIRPRCGEQNRDG